jgi:hypothetical protein
MFWTCVHLINGSKHVSGKKGTQSNIGYSEEAVSISKISVSFHSLNF